MQDRISVSLSSNEAMRPRVEKLKLALDDNQHFEWAPMGGFVEPPFDLQFMAGGTPRKTMHVEIKDFSVDHGSDYLSSILSGHLYEQILVAREQKDPVAVVILGDDNDVGEAIRKASSRESRGKRVDPAKLMEYYRMVEGFEANCIALGVPVWRLKTDPWKRLLLRVRKILQGGDLTGFVPAPADGERQAVGLSILAGKGIGPIKARSILDKFQLILEPWTDDCYLTDCDGIGEKLAMQIGDSKNFAMDCRKIIRPPKPRKTKGKTKIARAEA